MTGQRFFVHECPQMSMVVQNKLGFYLTLMENERGVAPLLQRAVI